MYIGEGICSEADDAAVTEADPFADPAGYKLVGGADRKAEGWIRTRKFAELLTEGGGDAQVVDDIQSQRYSKNLWNAAFSTMCSITRTPVSALVHPDVVGDTIPVVSMTFPPFPLFAADIPAVGGTDLVMRMNDRQEERCWRSCRLLELGDTTKACYPIRVWIIRSM